MNRYFSHITNLVTLNIIGVMLLIMLAIVVHWNYVLLPVIKAGEQTKADLLVTPYTELLESAIDNKDRTKLEELLNRLVLLVDPKLKKPMVLSIKVSLVSGEVFERVNSVVSIYSPFTTETPLFSPATSELVGVVELEYSAELFSNLVADAKSRLLIAVFVFIVILVLVQRQLSKLLQPLTELAAKVESIDFDQANELSKPQKNVAVEIKQVWQAINQLFLRLRQRDEQVRLEHEAAQVALAEKIKAVAANKAKSQFLANMSHELRTPLNAIIGYSEILKEEVIDSGIPNLEADLGKINLAGRSLLSLISEVLDLSKIEAGKMQVFLEDVKLPLLVAEVVDIIMPMVKKSGNEIEVDCSDDIGVIHIDIIKLRQALLNLLSNAAKFTQNGKISIKATRKSIGHNEWISIEVGDTGIGLTDLQIESLFVAFAQADSSTTRRYGGTGLGLTISRSFCRLMGGDITVNSTPQVGSTFTILLPVGLPQKTLLSIGQVTDVNVYFENQRSIEVQENQAVQDERRAVHKTILVIDDDPMACDMPMRHLRKSGYKVTCVQTAAEGIKKINRLKPDVILLDVMLQGMSGWHVLTYVKEHPQLLHIPVIMLTMTDEKNTAYALGASNYLMKPVDRDQLVKAVNACVRKGGIKSILIIDDDQDTRKLLRTILQNDGYFVCEAENGHLGLIKVAERRPSLILLDLLMPGMDGREFLSQLEQHAQWRDIPIVALTAKSDEHESHDILKRVDNVIEKGVFSIDKVLGIVRSYIENKNIQPVTKMDDKIESNKH